MGGLAQAVLAHNAGHGVCAYQSLAALKLDYPKLFCLEKYTDPTTGAWSCKRSTDVPVYLQKISANLTLDQPVVVVNADTSRILPPPASLQMASSSTSSPFTAAGEYEVDRVVADLKGKGQRQLAVLYAVVQDPQLGPTEGVLKVFSDAVGSAIEWQSQPMLGVLPVGALYAQTLSVGGAPILSASWGVGAHGTMLWLFSWDGQTFRAVPVVEPGGGQGFSFFADSGAIVTEAGLVAGDRGLDDPVNDTIVTTYRWEQAASGFVVDSQTIIRGALHRVLLPLAWR
jgi:hypothetical protein